MELTNLATDTIQGITGAAERGVRPYHETEFPGLSPTLRPEEDAGFLPRRDGTDQPPCYGAADGLTATRTSGAGRHTGIQKSDLPLR